MMRSRLSYGLKAQPALAIRSSASERFSFMLMQNPMTASFFGIFVSPHIILENAPLETFAPFYTAVLSMPFSFMRTISLSRKMHSLVGRNSCFGGSSLRLRRRLTFEP